MKIRKRNIFSEIFENILNNFDMILDRFLM